MQKLDFSAPWYVYRNKLAALFDFDEAVSVGDVTETDGGYSVTVSVSNHAKAYALSELFKNHAIDCGNVTLTVIVDDTASVESMTELLKDAFAHNCLIRGVETVANPTAGERTFVVVEPEVVQFWADNLADYRGNISLLAADVARDVFGPEIAFCTADLTEN